MNRSVLPSPRFSRPFPLRSPEVGFGFAESEAGLAFDSGNPWHSLFPLIRNWRAIGVCYALWVLFLLYDHSQTARLGSGWIWLSTFSAPLTHIGAFAFLSPLPWLLVNRLGTPWRFIVGLLFSILVCQPTVLLLPAIDGWFFRHADIKFDSEKLRLLYFALVGPVMVVVGGLIAARARSEELRLASEVEAQIAKNRLLQGQIHPHVLFNALNGLAELMHKSPKSAEGAIRHLSDLLRRILVASEHQVLPLDEERMIVSDFLALESIRLGDRLKVRWEWDGRLNDLEVPPLLLQPLVENAVKHGIAPCVSGGELVLRARSVGPDVILEVWNSGMPFAEIRSGGGIGLKNLRSRLGLNFGEGASVSIGPSGEGTLASIKIQHSQIGLPHETPKSPGRRR
jgi:hypothetical protein